MKTQSNIRIKRGSGKKMKTQYCSYETNPKINNMQFFFSSCSYETNTNNFHLVRMTIKHVKIL